MRWKREKEGRDNFPKGKKRGASWVGLDVLCIFMRFFTGKTTLVLGPISLALENVTQKGPASH